MQWFFDFGLSDIGHRHYRFTWVLGAEKIRDAKKIK